ncbi:MAG TPA: DUF1579 family protein [Polyangia bacterium]
MKMIRCCCSTALVAVSTLALTGLAAADEKKAAAPAPAAAPAAAGTMKPAAAPAAAPAGSKPAAAAPAAPAAGGAPAAAPAAPAAAPAMPAPSKELEAFMKGFEGNWKCETKFAPGAMGPGSPETTGKSTVKFKKDYNGFSWHGEFALAKSKTMPALSGVMQLGYDPGSGQLTVVSYDSMGSATMGAGPITGDTAVVTEDGYAMGMKVKMRETMTKKGPKEIYHKYEGDMGKGFQLMGEDTCKK